MDNISHTLVGAALGEAGLKRRTGLGMVTLMIAANLPDLDVLAIPFGQNLTFRRGWTHGPIGLLVLPVLLTLGMVAWDRWQARRGSRPPDRLPVLPKQLLLLSWIGALSHPFLDWLNTYGIRLLMPFSHEWFYGDALFIVDPWIWSALGLGIFLARRRQRLDRPHALRPARIALGAVVVYIALMITGSEAASGIAEREVAARVGAPAERVMAGPVPLDPFRRNIVYDTGDAYGFGVLAWTPRPEITLEAELLPKRLEHPAVRRAMREPVVRDFLYWSRFPFFHVSEAPSGYDVFVNDARFSREPTGGWAGRSIRVERELDDP